MKKRSRYTAAKSSAAGFTEMIFRLPAALGLILKSKAASYADSSKLREERLSIPWNESAARTVINEIEDMLRRGISARPVGEEKWSTEDLKLVREIDDICSRAGANNITRTEAYLECYQNYPELHWAFLAHMVSRNAGWNMTDLQSSRMTDVLTPEEKRMIYRFLERSNALIFQDAYPQLMLYMKSRELGASRFHLLSHFHVSQFMRPFWERFWIDRDSALLTVGLIINEQNYIEKRVVRHPYFQKNVTGKANLHLFTLAGLNQVVFPLLEDGAGSEEAEVGENRSEGAGVEERAVRRSDPGSCAENAAVRRLAGRTVSDFGSLPARIALGKGLYAMLMGLRAVRSGAERFAASVPHSGSRADYWPDLFTANMEKALTAKVQGSELLGGETLPAGQRLYSPKLLSAWGDTPYEPISREDWLKDHSALDGISAPQAPFLCDISREHRNGILKTALAHDAVSDAGE
ncbi:DUF2515 family protein [Paenibacillus puldeungensis]|uniref:DUF2515 family protein n=1 Tax=Paenibacillus puldeungensis TaxID=696536 RepID=A0ABW3S0Q5_9BACL